MASAMVVLVVSNHVGMMTQQIHKQASSVLNLRRLFEWMNKTLRKTEIQSAHEGFVKSWLLNVVEIALDAEGILDECGIESQGTDNGNPQSCCVFAFTCSQLIYHYQMGRWIKVGKDRMRSIMGDAGELKLVGGLIHSDQGFMGTAQYVKWGRASLMESDSKPVAIEPKFENALSLLDGHVVSVIVCVGMGGTGKTFLLQHVFNRRKDRFEKAIGLSVSQTYSLQKLQAAFALKIGLNEVVKGRVDEVQAAELIHDCLKSRGSLIVLDDVWRATREASLVFALDLPARNDTQCKIVVSARSRDVCRRMNASDYQVQHMTDEESWKLFCAFAFSHCQQNQPPHQLEGIARQIDGECARLPMED
ncbi:hypothetical protein SUGI_0386660 [Cryptomeria japonica]|uniref:disease resistance protein RPS5 isoform X1 n=1 Tax=Cryptomeria japonica TaxID=3369 RepID=UPI002408C268|nr:disease resistance protein RPS5 isoform X1 [Cryptomeria japonica]GLJ21140.1 hypothetical protein SUGI_0386660 [Cryptomeria japonica]